MSSSKQGSVWGLSAVLVASLALLVGCGGGGTPVGVPITIALSASLTTLNPGQASTITAQVSNDSSNKGVTWSLSPTGFGTLSQQTSTTVTYTAPANVPTATGATITATSVASSSVTAVVQLTVKSSAISISLSPVAPQTINQGQQLSINAALANDTNNKGVTWTLTGAGSLNNRTATSVTYVAPNNVAGSSPATVTATSVADANATAFVEITVFPAGAGPNVAALSVNSGPAGNSTNGAFVSVTICEPAPSTNCQTVDDVLVDTGSEGLRILQSAIPSLQLPTLADNSGNIVNNCVSFLDTSYLWGPVGQADIKIGDELASQSLMQVISSSNTGIPTACSNGGTVNDNTAQLLGANGILGVGLEPTDCELAGANFCDGSISAPPPIYFACPSSGCAAGASPISIGIDQQVNNPVVLFDTDNNGVLLQLPSPAGGEAPAVNGALIFGIATQANNGLGGALIFPLDQNDNFTTQYSGQTLTASFIDSGSNALFFPSSITVCADNTSFYCPPAPTMQQAGNVGFGSNQPDVVNFTVDNADTLFGNVNDFAYTTLAGPEGTPNTCSNGNGSCTFDWGLPFFYGRSVFTAIDGQNVANVGFGPFFAY